MSDLDLPVPPSDVIDSNESTKDDIDDSFYCPISAELMTEPVIDPDGYTAERKNYEHWIKMRGTSLFTRRPLSIAELRPNRALKDQIDAIRASIEANQLVKEGVKMELPPSPPAMPDPLALSDTTQPMADFGGGFYASATVDGLGLEIALTTPDVVDGSSRRPHVHVVMCIDVSYSMQNAAVAKDEAGESIDLGYTFLDITKQGAVTVVSCLTAGDYVSVVEFASGATVMLQPTCIDAEGVNRAKAIKAIQCLEESGTTNMAAGIAESVKLVRALVRDAPSHCPPLARIMLLTDGVPDRPARTWKDELESHRDANGQLIPIDCFGFGYGLDSQLLNEVSTVSEGNYAFIPDPGMLAECFSNAVANVLSIGISYAQVEITGLSEEARKQIKQSKVCGAAVSPLQSKEESDPLLLRAGALGFGKTHRVSISVPNIDISSLAVRVVTDAGTVEAELKQGSWTPYEHLRSRTVAVLPKVLEYGGRQLLDKAQEILNAHIEEFRGMYEDDDECEALIGDLIGEVMMGISSRSNFVKWGSHYLRSFCNAHSRQICNNFKDASVQRYASRAFGLIREFADTTFNALPPPTPSRSAILQTDPSLARAAGMSHTNDFSSFNSRGGVCFHGAAKVLLADGTYKHVIHVKRGDVLATSVAGQPALASQATDEVECIVRTYFQDGHTELCMLDGGWLGTPHHPVYQNGRWHHPKHLAQFQVRQCEYTYSFLMKSRAPTCVINGWLSSTLAHGLRGDVIEHEYFGTERVVDDLKKVDGWSDGRVTIEPDDIVRDAQTTFICGIRPRQSRGEEQTGTDVAATALGVRAH